MLYTAIAYGDDELPAHFDCVLGLLSDREQLAPGERVCYLGGGSFGVVRFPVRAGEPAGRRQGAGASLVVRKRIPFENSDPPPAWRDDLRRVARAVRRAQTGPG